MANYQHRLDRLEAAIAPAEHHFIWRDVGMTNREAVEAYAKVRGLGDDAVASVLENAVMVCWEG